MKPTFNKTMIYEMPKINKDTPIIGFAGGAGSGKDTAASFLIEQDPERFVRVAFADKLKEATAVLFGIDKKILDTEEGKSTLIDKEWFDDMTYRWFLQLLGTEGVRNNVDKNFWVKLLMRHITNLKTKTKTFIVTDVRFPNEKEAIECRGGIVYNIIRVKESKGKKEKIRLFHSEPISSQPNLVDYWSKYFDVSSHSSEDVSSHSSERALNSEDLFTLHNNGSKRKFKELIVSLLN